MKTIGIEQELVGKRVFIRTVTYFYTGLLEHMDKKFMCLSSVAWVADTGRFSAALSEGALGEVESYPDGLSVFVAIGSVIDVCEWRHELPRKAK